MLAHHPITGTPIRIFKTETHCYKNQKTLVWLQDAPRQPSMKRLLRWDTLVFGVQAISQWKESLGQYPSAMVIHTPTDEALEWIRSSAPREHEMLFLSKAVLEALTVDYIRQENFYNILCLEELGEVYPHILHKYTESDTDTTIALMIAVLFRASRLLGLLPSNEHSPLEEVYRTKYSLTVGPYQEPEELWFITQYYEAPKARRQREIQTCLRKNLECPYIDKIILLNEKMYPLEENEKLTQVNVGKRLTYGDVLSYIQKSIPENTLVVFANADIYLTDSWSSLWSLSMKDVFLSLLRYEEPEDSSQEPALFGPRPDSQDTWVVHSSSIQSRQWDSFKDFQFPFGKAGCDNAINVEMLRKKFLVSNPCLTFKTIHCHRSAVRTYDERDIVEKPLYLYLDPTGLHDLEPKQSLAEFEKSWTQPQPYSVRVHGTEKTLKTFSAMASRDEATPISSTGEALVSFEKKAQQLYQFHNSFMTPNSLTYGYKALYLSQQKTLRELWVDEKISHITPCLGLKSAIAVQYPIILKTPHAYLTQYLSSVLQIQQAGYKGDFFLPSNTPSIQDWFQHFEWDEKILPVIPRDTTVGVFAETLTMMTPKEKPYMYKEEITALRNALKGYQATTTDRNRVVILQDDVVLTTPYTKAIEVALEAKGYVVDIVYPKRSSAAFLLESMIGVQYAVAGAGYHDLYWIFPTETKIIEIQSELQIQGHSAYMAGACEVEFWVTLIPRGKPEHIAPLCVQKVLECFSMFVEKKHSILPVIIMPQTDRFPEFHKHSGDSFREMVDLWSEKGYVSVQKSTSTYFCWYGGVGETLLYDRATTEWLQNPGLERDWKKVLCGNVRPGDVLHGSLWSFWPRHPKLVEELAPQLSKTSYNERTKTMVFYGKVENQVQRKNRTNSLHKACDDFSMPDGAEKSYKLSPTEYLKALSTAKFGLCLRGFGAKCNREVECMAMGTVPVVAPDVDIEHYASPPVEGIHYIRLKSFDPEEAKTTIASISQEKWEYMSRATHQWWVENASAEGLWTVTQQAIKS